jgi:hypothetical protein
MIVCPLIRSFGLKPAMGIVEGRDFADVDPLSSVSHPLDDLTQGILGYLVTGFALPDQIRMGERRLNSNRRPAAKRLRAAPLQADLPRTQSRRHESVISLLAADCGLLSSVCFRQRRHRRRRRPRLS